MEGAARVFAGDFSGSTLSVQADNEQSAAFVVTPCGIWCRVVYLSGAITEITETGDMLRCRLADPTGAFNLVIGGRNSPLAEQFRKIPVPSFRYSMPLLMHMRQASRARRRPSFPAGRPRGSRRALLPLPRRSAPGTSGG